MDASRYLVRQGRNCIDGASVSELQNIFECDLEER